MKLKHIIALLAVAAVGLFAASCSNESDEPQQPGINLDEQVENVEFEIFADTIFTIGHLYAYIQNINVEGYESMLDMGRSLFLKTKQDYSKQIATEMGAPNSQMMWRSVCYNYWSTDEQGRDIKLSARACWAILDDRDLSPANILLCPHYTITNNAECPTQTITFETMFLCSNNLLILPDYIGFGTSADRVQPYVNHNIGAQNCIDALTAGYKVFRTATKTNVQNDFKLCVVGASQGAGNALGVHKWLDTHPDFADTWHFAYSFCCAGPYSPTVTFEKYFEQEQITNPCVIPLTLKAMLAAYPSILGSWTEDDFYSDNYLQDIKPTIDQMIASKKYSTGDINKVFFDKLVPETDSIKGLPLSGILSADALNRDSELCKAMFKCLANNDLTSGWAPLHPIYLTHDRGDDVVPYANAEAVAAAFPDKATLSTTNLGSGHLGSCVMWLLLNMSKAW
ncbi:MAG: hypothetical protein J6U04_03430 [Salinivirgaceae bacterium]|nr:hypothetical protein [Salinivirgaceae bacterium]